MREIKFRAWERVKKWVKGVGYTDEWIWRMNYNPIIDGEEVFGGGAVADINKGLIETEFFKPMQHTGLKDKNGTEIFEGDVIEWKQLNAWHKNMVYWLGSGFYADASEWVDYLNEPIGLSLISKLDARVIGNIFENPELLKGKE